MIYDSRKLIDAKLHCAARLDFDAASRYCYVIHACPVITAVSGGLKESMWCVLARRTISGQKPQSTFAVINVHHQRCSDPQRLGFRDY